MTGPPNPSELSSSIASATSSASSISDSPELTVGAAASSIMYHWAEMSMGWSAQSKLWMEAFFSGRGGKGEGDDTGGVCDYGERAFGK